MANKPLKSIKFPGLPDTYMVEGMPESAKAALLTCFRHVAWTDEHGQDYYDALESALYGSEPYWDYEWNASSRTLPEGMTAVAYDFTTEEGALFVTEPNLDFDYIGSCRMQIEMAGFVIKPNAIEFTGSNPQLQIINSVSGDNKQGVKFIWNFDGAGTSGVGAIGINGVNTILNIDTTTYHLIDITNNNNVYTLEVDGSPIALQQNTHQTPYLNHTGIITASRPDGNYYHAYIKTIKFKRL